MVAIADARYPKKSVPLNSSNNQLVLQSYADHCWSVTNYFYQMDKIYQLREILLHDKFCNTQIQIWTHLNSINHLGRGPNEP